MKAKEALSAEELIGVEKRKAMTLAEQIFAKSKEDLEREQKEAEEFVKRMNHQRHELERRKKEYHENEMKKQKDAEEKKKKEEEEKKKK